MTFYTKLQPLEQFEIVMMLAAMCFLSAIILREYFTDREIRIAGRVLGIAGFGVLAAFGWRMAAKVETLEQIARVQRASEIADQGFALADKEACEITSVETPDGTVVNFRGSGSVPTSARRSGRSSGGYRYDMGGVFGSVGDFASPGDGSADVPHDAPLRFIQ